MKNDVQKSSYLGEVIAVTNQKGGCGYGKSYIMESSLLYSHILND